MDRAIELGCFRLVKVVAALIVLFIAVDLGYCGTPPENSSSATTFIIKDEQVVGGFVKHKRRRDEIGRCSLGI